MMSHGRIWRRAPQKRCTKCNVLWGGVLVVFKRKEKPRGLE